VGANGIRVGPNGKPLKFRLAAFNEYPMDVTAAKKISSYLKAVGIGTVVQVMDENAFTNDNYDNANDDLYIWNWNADIDPGYLLSTMTTGQLLNGSDSEYSNPKYDALYVQQAAAVDPARRKQIVDQMQQILYHDAPYVILWYNVNVQAYRTDTWAGYVSVPPGSAPGAALRNMLRTTYIDLKPKAAAAASSGGSSSGTIVAIIVAAVVVIGVVAFVVLRRRSRTVETE
jgi:peptide/nickel transport system substrate-binding protein